MRLLDQVRGVSRAKHYAYRTEQGFVHWIVRYIRFHGVKHPNTMGTGEIEQFVTCKIWVPRRYLLSRRD